MECHYYLHIDNEDLKTTEDLVNAINKSLEEINIGLNQEIFKFDGMVSTYDEIVEENNSNEHIFQIDNHGIHFHISKIPENKMTENAIITQNKV